jgi:hypothetical protein
VRTNDVLDYSKVREVRAMLEIHVADVAALAASKNDIAAMERWLDAQAASGDDLEAAAQCDLEFHRTIMPRSGRPSLLWRLDSADRAALGDTVELPTRGGGAVALAIEYDVTPEGVIELVGLINAVEEDGTDPDGEAWLAWRQAHEDGGLGCVLVPPADLSRMEATEDPDELRAIVEDVILADRRAKEVPS